MLRVQGGRKVRGPPCGLPSISCPGGHHGHVRLGLGGAGRLLVGSALQRGPFPALSLPGGALPPLGRGQAPGLEIWTLRS